MKKMTLTDLGSIEASFGELVELDAVLVVSSKDAYLVSDAGNPDSADRVVVVAPRLERKLDAEVGGWMGGRFSYLDKVSIRGVLVEPAARNGHPILKDVTRIVLERDGAISWIDLN